MNNYKNNTGSTEEFGSSRMYITLLKSLILCLVLSLAMIVIYAIALSLTSISDESMPKITQTIVILSIVLSSMYGGKKIKKKGWLFGAILGLLFIVLLTPISVGFGQEFSFDKYFMIKMLMGGIVGLIGGVIGVNLN